MTREFLGILTAAALLAGSAAAVPAADAVAEGGRVRVTRDDCRRLVEHRPAPDVAYKPGVDVHGRQVAPADLPGGIRILPAEEVEFDVSFNPLRGATGQRFGRTELYVGKIKVNVATGAVTFNDVPLTDPEQAELAEKCRDVLRGK
jgi:hypothetical protein